MPIAISVGVVMSIVIPVGVASGVVAVLAEADGVGPEVEALPAGTPTLKTGPSAGTVEGRPSGMGGRPIVVFPSGA